jgi:hypothetical protein
VSGAGSELPVELVERMVALVRGLSDPQIDARYNLGVAEARAIAALLPEPVDPLLVMAREYVARSCEWFSDEPEQIAANIRSGKWDGANSLVADMYAALKKAPSHAV